MHFEWSTFIILHLAGVSGSDAYLVISHLLNRQKNHLVKCCTEHSDVQRRETKMEKDSPPTSYERDQPLCLLQN